MSPRRGPLAAAAATAGLAVVLVAHTAAPHSHLLGASPGTRQGTANGSQGASGSGGSGSGGSSASGGSGSSGGSTGPARSAKGSLEQYGYGELAVTVSVSGSRIVQVSVPRLLTAEQYSQQLAQQVIPMLRSEVLSAQSARISTISGATYTSEAYALSVQAALDKLHVK